MAFVHRKLWRQKPKQWGPLSMANSVFQERLNNLGLPPAAFAWFPVWPHYDIVNGIKATIIGTNLSFPNGPYGAYLDSGGTLSGLLFDSDLYDNGDFQTDGVFSIVAKAKYPDAQTNYSYVTAIGNRASGYYSRLSLDDYGSSDRAYFADGRTAGATIDRSDNDWYDLAAVKDGASKRASFVQACEQRVLVSKENTDTVVTARGAMNRISLCVNPGTSQIGSIAAIDYSIVFHRALTEEQIKVVFENIYAAIQPPTFRAYSFPSCVPKINFPGNGTTDVTQPITFSWATIPDALNYQLQIADTEAALDTLPDIDTTITAPTTTKDIDGLDPETTYYSRVRAQIS